MPLPDLQSAATGSCPDVLIEYGEVGVVGAADEEPQPIEGGAILAVEGVARYAVLGGRRIVVEPEPDAAERNVRLYLLGSAMGMLLHQRGLLPLHANAIEIGGKAVAFMGPSGAGKSTLAAWFLDRGYPVIADDVCVIRFDPQGGPMAVPGLPRLRLWRSALETLGKDPASYQRSYAGDDEYDKYDAPVIADGAAKAAVPIAAVYLLESAETFSVERLAGVEAAEVVFANTYRGAFVSLAESPRGHWEACLDLIRRSPVFRVARCWDLTRMDEQNEAILAHANQAGLNT